MRINNFLKFILQIFSVFLILFLILQSLSACGYDYSEVFLKNWQIDLPENMEEIFRKSEDNWGNYGIRYAVFKLKTEPTDFVDEFTHNSNVELEHNVMLQLEKASFDIPEKYLPDWVSVYYWQVITKEYIYDKSDKVIDYCYIIYFPESLYLSICQVFP